jgi:glycosyltransferase involved in cell wall biosynthesis
VVEVRLNDSSFNHWVKSIHPDWVVYDRFVLEEQFGWRVSEECPLAMQVIDLQDLHFVRKLRGEQIPSLIHESQTLIHSDLSVDWTHPDALRELAAIARTDASLVISSAEYQLLRDKGVAQKSLYLDPLSIDLYHPRSNSSDELKKHFVFVGNYRHPPNLDASRVLAKWVWPKLSKLVPDAELHLYGAYPPKEVMSLHCPEKKLRVLGPCVEIHSTLRPYRILLAPLRFGAGIKGKILEAFDARVGVVTTSIGIEGIETHELFPGICEDTLEGYSEAAARLYHDHTQCSYLVEEAQKLLTAKFDARKNSTLRIDFLLQREQELLQASNFAVRSFCASSTR